MSTSRVKAETVAAPAQVVAVVEEAVAVEPVAVERVAVEPVAVEPVAVASVAEPAVVTNETVIRANRAVGNEISAPAVVTTAVEPVAVAAPGAEVVRVNEPLVPAKAAKPGEFFDDRHHHGKKPKERGHKAEVRVVATEQALLDDVARYRGNLVKTIDELHTRLSPKYQIDQLKSTWTQAGTDALSILKNEGSPVDETRKKKAESILKAGGAVTGLFALHGLRKLLKSAKTRHTVRRAIEKGVPDEHVELLGVVEGMDVDDYEAQGLSFDDAIVESLADFPDFED